MRSEPPEGAAKEISPVSAFFIPHFAAASTQFSEKKLAYVTQLKLALGPPPKVTGTPQGVFCQNEHLKLVLEERRPRDRFEPWTHDGRVYSIAGGVCIQPRGPGILKCLANRIEGLMFDTTWEVMWAYVTSILVAVSRNTAFPIAFAFGPGETAELYELFYTEFEKYEVNLGQFIVESDQGGALRSTFQKHGNRQLICLHHFLRTLKDRNFGFQVASLVKCRSEAEIELLYTRFVSYTRCTLNMYEHSPEIWNALRKELGKAGLVFDGER
jgi:hypothetical protein